VTRAVRGRDRGCRRTPAASESGVYAHRYLRRARSPPGRVERGDRRARHQLPPVAARCPPSAARRSVFIERPTGSRFTRQPVAGRRSRGQAPACAAVLLRNTGTPSVAGPAMAARPVEARRCARLPIRTRSAPLTTTVETLVWQCVPDAHDAARRCTVVDRVTPVPPPRAATSTVLDVETMNSWQHRRAGPRAAKERDVADAQRRDRRVAQAGVERVGVYSDAYQWRLITGGTKITRAVYRRAAVAGGLRFRTRPGRRLCPRRFTDGPVVMSSTSAPTASLHVLAHESGGA